MNVQAFQHKWGGEDWEMIDRVLAAGLEVERLRMPGFYHFYHSKQGMWDNRQFLEKKKMKERKEKLNAFKPI